MKKLSKQFYLLIVGIFGIGTILFTSANLIIIGSQYDTRETMNFLSSDFWNLQPSSGEVFQSTFGDSSDWNTAYTQNRSGYTTAGCDFSGVNVIYANSGDIINAQKNELWILNSGNYTMGAGQITGSCIGIIGSEKVNINGIIDIGTSGKNIIIDNANYDQIGIQANTVATTEAESIGMIISNLTGGVKYRIIGDIVSTVTGTAINNLTTTGNFMLTNGDGVKKINVIIETGNIFLGHYERNIVLIRTLPSFFAETINHIPVISGGVYSTGVNILFNTETASGATINGTPYIAGNILTGAGDYEFELIDLLGNSTGTTFKIDYTTATFTGLTFDGKPVISGGVYNTGVIFTFSNYNIASATIDLIPYTSGTLFIGTGLNKVFRLTDLGGNSTGVTFSIDRTSPLCTGISPSTGTTVSGSSLDFRWTCTDAGGDNSGLSGLRLIINDAGNSLIYSTGLNKTATGFNYTANSAVYNWKIVATDNAGNDSTLPFQQVTYNKAIIVGIQSPGILYQNRYYVSGSIMSLGITGNMVFGFQLTGDINTSTPGVYTNGTLNKVVILSGNDGIKNITMNYNTGSQTGSIGPISFYLDTANPTISGNYPTNGLKTKQTDTSFTWTAADTGAGINSYSLEITKDSGSPIILYTGSATSYTKINMTSGVYTWKVKAIDYAGNSQETTQTTFTIDNTFPIIYGVTGNIQYNTDVTPTFNVGTGLLNGTGFVSGTTLTGDGHYVLIVTNDIGNTTTADFYIDKTLPTLGLISPISGVTLTTSNNVLFQRSGFDTNISGYQFNLYGPYNTGITLANISSIMLTNVPNDNYTWEVKATDRAGNLVSKLGNFTVALALSGSINITGVVNNNGIAYTNTNFGIQVSSNKNAGVMIIGDLAGIVSGPVIAGINTNFSVIPNVGDGIKTITVQVNTGAETFTKIVTGYYDTTAPSTPTFVSPLTNYSGAFTVTWATSTDAGVGVNDYIYTIMSGNTSVKSGTGTTTSLSIANMEIGGTGTYTMYLAARDKLGNISASGNISFGYIGIPDVSPDNFSLSREYDADLDTDVESEKITVAGLSTNTKVLASTEDGDLIINGTNVGTTGYVVNGDKVQISIISSSDYDDITEGLLIIGDKSSVFKVVTIADEDNNNDEINTDGNYDISTLSTTQKLHISLIYNVLSDMYNDSKQEDFMLSLKYLVKEKIITLEDDNEDEENIETMKYLYNLINKDFEGSGSGTDDSSYTAPNGKKYNITYKTSDGYTATNFIKIKYFTSLSEIKTYIDKNNPASAYSNIEIDQSRSSSSYKAPNGKVYVFFKTTDGKYGSNNFQTAKLFTDLEVMKKHIAINNK